MVLQAYHKSEAFKETVGVASLCSQGIDVSFWHEKR